MFWVIEQFELAAPFEFGQRQVRGVGAGVADDGVGVAPARPVFALGVVGGEEGLEVDRLVAVPDAVGRAEIGDARLGADARAGEDDQRLGIDDQVRQLADRLVGADRGGDMLRVGSRATSLVWEMLHIHAARIDGVRLAAALRPRPRAAADALYFRR